MSGLAIETIGLGKRYGRVWALRDCSIEVPTGRVSGLVGANGAGKTTLLRILAGLSRPTTGSAAVTGRPPADDAAFLAGIGYLAQEVPLYRRWRGRPLGPRCPPERGVGRGPHGIACAGCASRSTAR
jgi:ABC-2 type transport system ATP-binding protein